MIVLVEEEGGGSSTVQYNQECLMLMAGKLILGSETISQCSLDKRLSYFISSHLALVTYWDFQCLKFE